MALSDLDNVRLLVGDTDDADQLLSNTEITEFIDRRQVTTNAGSVVTNIPAAAADAAGAIAAKFARQFNFAEDGQRFDRAQKYGHYVALAQDLRKRSGGQSVPVTSGTI